MLQKPSSVPKCAEVAGAPIPRVHRKHSLMSHRGRQLIAIEESRPLPTGDIQVDDTFPPRRQAISGASRFRTPLEWAGLLRAWGAWHKYWLADSLSMRHLGAARRKKIGALISEPRVAASQRLYHRQTPSSQNDERAQRLPSARQDSHRAQTGGWGAHLVPNCPRRPQYD